MALKFLQERIVPAKTKIILLILDGLGGLPKEAGGRTELETACTPQLDVLAGVMGAAGSTVRIVQKAVSVLEEELAAGINTTQKLEQKVVDVDKLRSADPHRFHLFCCQRAH